MNAMNIFDLYIYSLNFQQYDYFLTSSVELGVCLILYCARSPHENILFYECNEF